jgi:hypothetical protein
LRAIETVLLRFAAGMPYDDRAAGVHATLTRIARKARWGLRVEDGDRRDLPGAGCALSTRNVADFDSLPVDVVNPWEVKPPAADD